MSLWSSGVSLTRLILFPCQQFASLCSRSGAFWASGSFVVVLLLFVLVLGLFVVFCTRCSRVVSLRGCFLKNLFTVVLHLF